MSLSAQATRLYEKGDVYKHIDRLGSKLKGLQDAVQDTRANAYVTGYGAIAKVHLLKNMIPKKDLKSLITNADQRAEKNYFRYLIARGVLAMTPTEVHSYVSLPHTEEGIEKTLTATEDFLRSTKK